MSARQTPRAGGKEECDAQEEERHCRRPMSGASEGVCRTLHQEAEPGQTEHDPEARSVERRKRGRRHNLLGSRLRKDVGRLEGGIDNRLAVLVETRANSL